MDLEALDLGRDNTGPLTELCNLDKGLYRWLSRRSIPDIGNDKVQGSHVVRDSPKNLLRLQMELKDGYAQNLRQPSSC